MRELLRAVLCLAVVIGQFQNAAACTTLKCQSTGGLKTCTPIIPRNNRISKLTAFQPNVNGHPCLEGYHYGCGPTSMWVDLRCGGEFGICYRPRKEMSCVLKLLTSTVAKRYYTIDLNDNVFLMYVQRKLNDKCIKGKTYDIAGNRVWVSSGCRARFYICVLNN